MDIEQLEKLQALKQKGAITQKEFELQKKEILDNFFEDKESKKNSKKRKILYAILIYLVVVNIFNLAVRISDKNIPIQSISLPASEQSFIEINQKYQKACKEAKNEVLLKAIKFEHFNYDLYKIKELPIQQWIGKVHKISSNNIAGYGIEFIINITPNIMLKYDTYINDRLAPNIALLQEGETIIFSGKFDLTLGDYFKAYMDNSEKIMYHVLLTDIKVFLK